MKTEQWSVLRARDGTVLIRTVYRARGFLQRWRGLAWRCPIGPDTGLLLPRCRAVHTCGMRFPLDLIFLDAEGRVVSILRNVRPWRTAYGGRRTQAVLEIQSGWLPAASLSVGDQLLLRSTMPETC